MLTVRAQYNPHIELVLGCLYSWLPLIILFYALTRDSLALNESRILFLTQESIPVGHFVTSGK